MMQNDESDDNTDDKMHDDENSPESFDDIKEIDETSDKL